MTHASLFSGIGGPEVAAEMLGWENVFHCEINPFGKAVLEYWFPNSVSYDDITKQSFKEWRGRVDVLTGGFPCQPFSYAGKRGGREDERYLWPEMLRVIDEVRPSWVIGENVAGITTMVEGGVLYEMGGQPSLFGEGDEIHGYELRQSFTIERICRDLECLGYSVQPLLIPAASVGAPHRRDRIFIIAHDDNADLRNGERYPGKDAGAEEGERIYKRDNLQQPSVASAIRSEIQGDAKNAMCDGFGFGQYDEPGSKRNERNIGARDSIGVCGEKRTIAPDPDINRGGEVYEYMEPGIADGTKSLGDGRERNAAGAGPADPVRKGLEGKDKSGNKERGERMHLRGHSSRCDREDLPVGERWAEFPTVSPIHRGNDGIPFPLDDLTLSPAGWRTESLKAYGNAIVPQVMYEIFNAIEKVTNESE